MSKRPDMRDYFRARIHFTPARLPQGVKSVDGDVDSRLITVAMEDGTSWHWAGGRWNSHKPPTPLMPRPIPDPNGDM